MIASSKLLKRRELCRSHRCEFATIISLCALLEIGESFCVKDILLPEKDFPSLLLFGIVVAMRQRWQ
jgi:hypothetical protein